MGPPGFCESLLHLRQGGGPFDVLKERGSLVADNYFVAGDWGTSRLRLLLCRMNADGGVTVTAEAEGAGVKDVSDFEAAFSGTLRHLPGEAAGAITYIAGMAGSSLGWRETPYAECPVGWEHLTRRAVRVAAGDNSHIWLLPGAACVNRFGLPDFMRGEETQLLGWWFSHAMDGTSPSLVCLPGTHAKWAIASREGIERFETSVQGEMFDVLRRHSILTRGATAAATRDSAFRRGVALMRDHPRLPLSEALFSVRSLQLSGKLRTDEAPSYLSGILLGADVRDIAAQVLAAEDAAPSVSLVGDPGLCTLYASAMSDFGIASTEHDGREATVSGLAAVHRTARLDEQM